MGGVGEDRQGLIDKLAVDHFETERENAAARIAELTRHMTQKETSSVQLSKALGGGWSPTHAYGAVPISPRLEQSSK